MICPGGIYCIFVYIVFLSLENECRHDAIPVTIIYVIISCILSNIIFNVKRDENINTDTMESSYSVIKRAFFVVNMMTSSNGNIFRVTGHLCGEFTGPGEFPAHGPVMRSFDVFFDLYLNKRLNTQSWGWWFKTPSPSLWRHCNEQSCFTTQIPYDTFVRRRTESVFIEIMTLIFTKPLPVPITT